MLKLWELVPSPNNIKVRLALGYKQVPFESLEIDPFDRSDVLEVSGQELTPVAQDRGVTIVDSEAILHYLDANYRDTPRLFPELRAGRYACDAWKKRVDEELASHWFPVFRYAIKVADTLDDEALKRFKAALAVFEDELDDKEASFHEDPEMAVCDLRIVEWAVYGLPPQGLIDRCKLFEKFRAVYDCDPDDYPSITRLIERWSRGIV